MMQPRFVAIPLYALLSIALLLPSCDSGGENPAPSANLGGTVRASEDGTAIPGATVIAGSRQTVTAADGAFELRDLPAETVTVQVSAGEYYDSYSQSVALQGGDNTHDVLLERRTIFEHEDDIVGFTLYAPRDVLRPRGVLLILAGQTAESRSWVRGSIDPNHPVADVLETLRARYIALASEYDLVLLGADTQDNTSASALREFFAALDHFAEATERPELDEAPILVWGHSLGGCTASLLVSFDVERMLGFVSQKGGCHVVRDHGGSKIVPGYFFIGENDTPSRDENITDTFEINRSAAAVWALAVQPGAGHEPVEAGDGGMDLVLDWMETVLVQGLPESVTPGQPVSLSPVNEASGWLGNRQTFEIAPFACYADDPGQASWLPSEQTARDWQAFSSSGMVTAVTPCE